MKSNIYFFSTLAISIAVVALRVISYLFYFDGTFFTDNSISTIVIILLCFVPLCFGIIFSHKEKIYKYEYISTYNISLGIINLFLVFSTAFVAYSMWEKERMELAGFLNTNSVMGVSFRIPFLIVTVLLSFYFLFSSIINLLNKSHLFVKLKLVCTIPIVWATVFVVYSYVHHGTSLLLIETFFALLSPASLAMILISVAKLLSGLDINLTAYRRLHLFAGFAYCVNISSFITSAILLLLNVDNKIELPIEVQFVAFVMAVSVMSFLHFAQFHKHRISEEKLHKPKRYKKRTII